MSPRMRYITMKMKRKELFTVVIYDIISADAHFNNLSEEECVSKIRDLFKQDKPRLDTDKRVNILNVVQIYKDESQEDPSTSFTILVDTITSALYHYELSQGGPNTHFI